MSLEVGALNPDVLRSKVHFSGNRAVIPDPAYSSGAKPVDSAAASGSRYRVFSHCSRASSRQFARAAPAQPTLPNQRRGGGYVLALRRPYSISIDAGWKETVVRSPPRLVMSMKSLLRHRLPSADARSDRSLRILA